MNQNLVDAIDDLRKYPDFTEYHQFKWSDQDFKALEGKTGLRLPRDVRDVCSDFGAIGLSETELYFRGRYSDGEAIVGEVQGLFNDLKLVLDFHETFVDSDDIPNRLETKYIVFGTADGGNSFLLVDGTKDDSPVYFWPLSFDPIGEGDNAQGVAKVADSLPDFIKGLRTVDEI